MQWASIKKYFEVINASYWNIIFSLMKQDDMMANYSSYRNKPLLSWVLHQCYFLSYVSPYTLVIHRPPKSNTINI